MLHGDERGAVVAVGWTGYGSSVALLLSIGSTLALEALTLCPEKGPGAAGLKRVRLAYGLPASLRDDLVAPPLAGATATYLVSSSECCAFPHDEPHQGGATGPGRWSASAEGEWICAAAMNADGEVFLATADPRKTGSGLALRAADGAVLARLEAVHVPDGEGVGFAVQRTGAHASAGLYDDLIFDVWRDGKLSRHRLSDRAGSTRMFDMPGLAAQPRSWVARLREKVPVAWLDWRCAASGVYPVATSETHPRLCGLKLNGEVPELVRYGQGPFQAVISSLAEQALLIDASGLQLIDVQDGSTRARQASLPGPDDVFATTSAGTIIRLSSDRADEVLMSGLIVRAGNLENGFRARLRRPGDQIAAASRLLRPDLQPIETDDGLLLGFEEGAGNDARLLLWHVTRAMRPEAVQ